MNKKVKIGISLTLLIGIFVALFFFFCGPQSEKVLVIDGTEVNTPRYYESMKYPLYQSTEMVVDSMVEEKLEYKTTHLHYLPFLVSIEDFMDYVRTLQNEGFLVITAINPSLLEGKGCVYELAKPLPEEGYSLLVTVNYGYGRPLPTISYVKIPGEVSKLEEDVTEE